MTVVFHFKSIQFWLLALLVPHRMAWELLRPGLQSAGFCVERDGDSGSHTASQTHLVGLMNLSRPLFFQE